MAKINLIGQKFNRWTVIDEAPSRNNGKTVYWLCKCDCGTIKEVRGQELKNGRSKSCGCFKKDQQINNIIQQKFNRLTVVDKTNKTTKDHYVIWKCLCECGNVCEVDTHSLQKGNTQSCGCLQKERTAEANMSRKIDLTNKTFGKLTVIKCEYTLNNAYYWQCQCECGNKVVVRGEYLRSGHKKSCGCLKQSVGEYNIEQILKNNNISFITEYNPGIHKFFDFAIVDNDQIIRLVEFDGIQHFEENNFFKKRSLYETQRSDQVKNEYALSHNIPLVRIPYWERDNITLEMIMGKRYEVPKPAQPTV